jgi:Uma2 family endonuclease
MSWLAQLTPPDAYTCIPAGIVDLESYRRWVRSDAYPERGRFAYFHGVIWVDLMMEQLFTHNLVRTEITAVLASLIKREKVGYFFSDRASLNNLEADLSTEPDGTFVSYAAINEGRVRLVEGAADGHTELEGSPDIVLEVVSDSSVRKDTVVLPDLYWQAGITEFWRVDARRAPLRFEILRHGRRGYTATRRRAGGWLLSNALDRSFRLTQEDDPLGNPLYTLEVRR